MAESKFKSGDIVQLKSGGPQMTVRKIKELEDPSINDKWFDVQCEWFDNANKRFEKTSFREEMIESFTPPTSLF